MSAGLAIYDTMQYIRSPVSTVCIGQAASMGSLLLCAGAKGKRYRPAECAHHGPPAVRRRPGPGDRHRDPGARDPDAAQAAERDLCPPHRPADRGDRAQAGARQLYVGRGGRDFGLVDQVVENRPVPAEDAGAAGPDRRLPPSVPAPSSFRSAGLGRSAVRPARLRQVLVPPGRAGAKCPLASRSIRGRSAHEQVRRFEEHPLLLVLRQVPA